MNGPKGNPNSLKGKLLMGQLDKSMVIWGGRGLRGKFLMDQLEIEIIDPPLANSWQEHGMFID